MDKYDLGREAKSDADRDALRGQQLSVLEYHAGAKAKTRRAFNNVYVKGFPKDAAFTDESLAKLFQEFGDIQSTSVMRDGSGESKGFGFVCFKESVAAERAVQAVQKHEAAAAEDGEAKDADGAALGVRLSDLYVREAKKKSVRLAELQMSNFKYKKSIMFFSLFVKNFPVGTTDEELRIYFQTACQGEVSRVNIVPGTQQAFVNFEKQDQCKMAKEFAGLRDPEAIEERAAERSNCHAASAHDVQEEVDRQFADCTDRFSRRETKTVGLRKGRPVAERDRKRPGKIDVQRHRYAP